MKARVRELTSRRTVNDYEKWKIDLKQYVVGWVNYYKLADMGSYLQRIQLPYVQLFLALVLFYYGVLL